MSSAYQLKPWTQVVIPHQDILDGKLDNSVYAAKLGSVVRQDPNCPSVYRYARQFFAATYLTHELKDLLESVLRRLCGESGNRVLQLRTPFGGGKTHALISLYHVARNRQDLVDHPDFASLPDPGAVAVATFIGDDFSATQGIRIPDGPQILTPWGYLAWQLGGQEAYEVVRLDDEQRVAPGNDVWRRIISDRPVLILLDEFLNYVENALGVEVQDSSLGKQVLTFIKKLPDVISELPKAVLVYSLQASVQEAVGSEGLLGTLDKLVSRNDAKKEPVSGDEVMRVVQRRLFQTVGEPATIQEIAYQQADLFRKFRESYAETERGKQEVQQQAALLAERIQLSYPFHPDLLDLMYHRWGTLPSYQRTRGALQFLASVVYSLRESNSLLISPGDILFQNEAVRGSFFTQVGERERYSAVIEADLIGRKAKVKTVDTRIAQDSPALGHLKVATRLASAILMYSFGARDGEERGALEQEVTASCLTPGLDRNVITATLSDLRENLLYLHYTGRRYRFETKPNLNKLIADEESKISGDNVLEKIREELGKALQSSNARVVLWPKDSSAISDREPQFSVVYLGHDWAEKSQDSVFAEVMNWVEQRGNDKRDYKNALAFVIPNKAQIDKARKSGRTAEAIAALIKDKAKYKFGPEDLEVLNEKLKDAMSDISAAVRRLYDCILLPVPNTNTDETSPVRLELIDLQSQLNTSHNLQDRVLDALKNHVFTSITTSKLMRLSGLEDREPGYITGDELVSYFFRFPGYPKVISPDAIKQAILKAIQQGLMGYVPYMVISPSGAPQVENPSLISYERVIPANELDLSGYLLAPSWVKQFLAPLESQELPEVKVPPGEINVDPSTNFQVGPSTPASSTSEDKATVDYKSQSSSIERTVLVNVIDGKQPARHYKLEAITDKSKLFDLFNVLQSLSDKAEDMTIKIEVRAHTTKEFDRSWISGAVEEPLDELDIRASTWLE